MNSSAGVLGPTSGLTVSGTSTGERHDRDHEDREREAMAEERARRALALGRPRSSRREDDARDEANARIARGHGLVRVTRWERGEDGRLTGLDVLV